MERAARAPTRCSTKAMAMSEPAVTPELVHTFPSTTQRARGTQVMSFGVAV
jgi:hypothetical protein